MARAPDLSGSALDGRYELHALIGEGAFGRVYRGRDRRLARAVAIKVIKPWWAEDSAWVQRFQREAQLLARISDPGIVQIYDIGHATDGPYYVAELIEGESLAERLQRGALAPAQARAIAVQLCDALAGAHAQGIVHCDVKPANVLITDAGKVKVGDFGVARLAEGTSQAPSATVAGTPRYMSPEQARGQPTGPATDVYSAGVVLYEMLAGEPPFVHGSAVELGLRHVQEQPPTLPANIPNDLRELVARALAKDPRERYRDAAAMAEALRASGPLSLSEASAIDSERAARNGAGGAASEASVQEGASAGTGTGTAGSEASGPAVGSAGTGSSEAATIDRSSAPTISAAAAATRVMGAGGGAPGRGAPSSPAGRGSGSGSRRPLRVIAVLVTLLIAAACLVAAVLLTGASAAHTSVPALSGLSRSDVQSKAQRGHVQIAFSTNHSVVAAGIAIGQHPSAGTRVIDGATIHVVLSSGPRWRELTTFSGVNNGHSVPFQILGAKWRIVYHISYESSCTLLLVCFGPSAEVDNLGTESSFGSFELGEGETETHTFNSGPGLYRIAISGGHDSARWTMTVEDYD